jgi:hypothetical protein
MKASMVWSDSFSRREIVLKELEIRWRAMLSVLLTGDWKNTGICNSSREVF